MNDLERAKKLLQENESYTCVLCKGDTVYTSTQKGIAPMLAFLEKGTELTGFSAADRIIGKAAAMLFALAGVKEAYAAVVSKAAIPVLEQYKITYSFDEKTDFIINREKTDICPMEKAVEKENDCEAAYAAIQRRIQQTASTT